MKNQNFNIGDLLMAKNSLYNREVIAIGWIEETTIEPTGGLTIEYYVVWSDDPNFQPIKYGKDLIKTWRRTYLSERKKMAL